MVPKAEGRGGREIEDGARKKRGKGRRRQKYRQRDKFSFASKNEGSCGFSIMIPPHADYYLRFALKWLHACSKLKSESTFKVKRKVASDLTKEKKSVAHPLCVCVHHLQTTVTFKGQNSDMINEMQEREKSESLFSV